MAALLLATVPYPSAYAQESWRFKEAHRVVAFADVHGAYPELVELLQATGLIDADLHWAGGATQAVSLGDLLDRGPDARRVLDLVMRLQDEARTAGGAVHVVLGNHELMNLIGDWRYVSAADYASFAADETAKERETAYAEFAAGKKSAEAATRAEFDRTYPPGYFARRRAFAADGHYGAWLLTLPAIIVVNDTAYVHGGVSPLVAEQGLEINKKVQTEVRRYLALRQRLAAADVLPAGDWQHDTALAHDARTADRILAARIDEFIATGDAPELSANGPLWYRGDVYCKPLLETGILSAGLERLGAKRAVVGHTPTADHRVRGLYDGKLIMLDTGMNGAYFHGRPSALVSEADRTYVQYAMPAEQAALDVSGNAQAYGLTSTALRDALEHGTVTTVERANDASAWRVRLQYANETIDASFYRKADGGDLELAAAALDDLLGAGLITPTVQREVDGQPGALQLRYADAMTEAQRRERRIAAGAWCPLEPQLAMMRAFDLLTANRSRNATNVVFNNDLSDLTLTDYRRAFGTDFTLPANLDRRKLDIPPPFVTALRSLDEASAGEALDAWLGRRQIAALLARRDQIVSR
jgi:Calcineurin-like phosphoesterase